MGHVSLYFPMRYFFIALVKHCNFTCLTMEEMGFGSVSTSFGTTKRGECDALIVFDCCCLFCLCLVLYSCVGACVANMSVK